MNEITTTVFGNIATDPRQLVTATGKAVTSFRLASTVTRFDRSLQGYVEGDTTFLTVSCWRGLAFNAAQSLVKGQPVIVHGTLRVRDWEQEGRSGREVELDALTVGHDLRRGRSTFDKVTRSATEPPVGAGPGAEVDAGALSEAEDSVASGVEVAA